MGLLVVRLGGCGGVLVALEAVPERLHPLPGCGLVLLFRFGLGLPGPDGGLAGLPGGGLGALEGGLLGEALAERDLDPAAALRQALGGPLGDHGDVVLHGDRRGDLGAGGAAPLLLALGPFDRAEFGLGRAYRADAVRVGGGDLVGDHLTRDDHDGADTAVGRGTQ